MRCWSDPVERCVQPHDRAAFLCAPDETLGAYKKPDEAGRVLVVEDDFLVAIEVEAALLDAGFIVVGVAASAEEAIALAAAEHPALVVMDIRLASERDGIDAAIELFRDHQIRCIFASAHADQNVRQRAAAAKPFGWVQKPYTMDSLIDLIRQSLKGDKRS